MIWAPGQNDPKSIFSGFRVSMVWNDIGASYELVEYNVPFSINKNTYFHNRSASVAKVFHFIMFGGQKFGFRGLPWGFANIRKSQLK